MEPEEIATRLALNVRRLMAAQDPEWNQERLGRELGTGSGNVVRLLSGRHSPTAQTLAKLATLFGVDVCDLLCSVSKKPKKK